MTRAEKIRAKLDSDPILAAKSNVDIETDLHSAGPDADGLLDFGLVMPYLIQKNFVSKIVQADRVDNPNAIKIMKLIEFSVVLNLADADTKTEVIVMLDGLVNTVTGFGPKHKNDILLMGTINPSWAMLNTNGIVRVQDITRAKAL